jgi:heterodisulfide reductase subunit C
MSQLINDNTEHSDASVFTYEVTDEVLEAAAGDSREMRCSQCGGTCNSRCSSGTR